LTTRLPSATAKDALQQPAHGIWLAARTTGRASQDPAEKIRERVTTLLTLILLLSSSTQNCS
jgi:hypothetical protein